MVLAFLYFFNVSGPYGMFYFFNQNCTSENFRQLFGSHIHIVGSILIRMHVSTINTFTGTKAQIINMTHFPVTIVVQFII